MALTYFSYVKEEKIILDETVLGHTLYWIISFHIFYLCNASLTNTGSHFYRKLNESSQIKCLKTIRADICRH